jgi:hypothetical protein
MVKLLGRALALQTRSARALERPDWRQIACSAAIRTCRDPPGHAEVWTLPHIVVRALSGL